MDRADRPWQRITVSIPYDVATDLRLLSAREDRSMSYLVGQAVIAYLAERAAADVCPECKRPASA